MVSGGTVARLAVLVLLLYGRTNAEYVPRTGCSDNDVCLYSYTARLLKVMGGTESQLRFTTDVKATCESVGTFGDLEASRHCISLEKSVIYPQDELDDKESEKIAQQADELLKEPFCFIQTSEGKIVSVEHSPDDMTSAVNMKKGIAAAFQGNFKKTSEEIEEDTLSKHVSRYSYETVGEDHVIMYRTVDSDDVMQSTFNDPNDKPTGIQKSEIVEYKKGILQTSSGTVKITANGPLQPQELIDQTDEPVTYDASFGTNELSGEGKYSLKLQKCIQKSSVARRSVTSLQFTRSGLNAMYEKDKSHYNELASLRKNVPSIKPLLLRLHSNFTDISISNIVRSILILEAENVHLPDTVPAIMEVMDYLSSLSNASSEQDKEMKALLYSFLAVDGSIDSQEALLKAIQTTSDQKERNTLTAQLAFVSGVHPDTLSQIESLISSSNDTTDTLILSYGALASSLSPDLQHRIVSFLESRINQTTDTTILIHYIHSLGNTKSGLANRVLLHILNTQKDADVQLAVIYALRFSTGSKEVQSTLQHVIKSDPSDAVTEMVLRSLISGAEEDVKPISDQLFETLLSVVNRNNTELKMMMSYYIHVLGSKAPKRWSSNVVAHLKKRGTTWNEKNELYNLVQDARTRDADLSSYPINKAYIWAKSFGVSKVGMRAAFGAFQGFGGYNNPSSYKFFSKGIAQAYAFGHSKIAFEALVLSEKQPGVDRINNKLYASIVGIVLVNYHSEIPTCESRTYPLYKSPTYTLLQFSPRLYIYVGYLTFQISLTARIDIDAGLSGCVRECTSAKGELLPSVTVEASADAMASLLELVRGGIGLTGTIKYQVSLGLQGSYALPKGPFELCMNLRHGWPDNRISIYVFYQIRSVKICRTKVRLPYPCGVKVCHKSIKIPCGVKTCQKRRIRYPCGVKTCAKSIPYPCGVKICFNYIPYPCGFGWSEKHKWEAASKEWRLPSHRLFTLWSSCSKKRLHCPEIPLS